MKWFEMSIPPIWLEKIKATHHNPRLLEMFERCYRNTFDTTVQPQPDGSVFVVTGDIPAMWLRDSTAQVRPYLLLAHQPEIRTMLEGVLERQLRCVLHDPYANAFNLSANSNGHQTDQTAMTALVWERKYEIDSLCAPIQLAQSLFQATSSRAHLETELFAAAMQVILETWRIEQHHQHSVYSFVRPDCPETDTLPHVGRGAPVGYTGMTWSGFRPSDDACRYGYLVPSNMLATVCLRFLEQMLPALRQPAQKLRLEIERGLEQHAVVQHPKYGEVWAYETDGLGHHLLIDDANVPSLLSAPYFGFCDVQNPRYQRTRAMILSESNPYYFVGQAARGIGSPHTPPDFIWCIGLCMQGLTSVDAAEQRWLLEMLLSTDAGTGLMHESFHKDDPSVFTRDWFAWANSLFAEFVLHTVGVSLPHPKTAELA
jgi:uncharacterized protein